MRPSRRFLLPMTIASIVMLTACESAPAAETPSAGTTTTNAVIEAPDATPTPETPRADTTTTETPGTEPGPGATDAPTPVTPDATTPEAPSPADEGAAPGTGVDPTTGLAARSRVAAPLEAVPPDAEVGDATLSIVAGGDSFSASGGTCTVYDGVVYVWVGDPNDSNAILMFTRGSGADSGLTWQLGSDRFMGAGGIENEMFVTLGEAGTSGTFSGEYVFADPTTSGRGAVTGTFSCTPAPLAISGNYPLSMRGLRCDVLGNSYSIGAAGGDAARLDIDPSSITDDGQFEGALSWRVGDREFQSLWLRGRRSSDGTFGSFIALTEATDTAEQFKVTGGFSCLGGG